jgi:hypothetical protein
VIPRRPLARARGGSPTASRVLAAAWNHPVAGGNQCRWQKHQGDDREYLQNLTLLGIEKTLSGVEEEVSLLLEEGIVGQQGFNVTQHFCDPLALRLQETALPVEGLEVALAIHQAQSDLTDEIFLLGRPSLASSSPPAARAGRVRWHRMSTSSHPPACSDPKSLTGSAVTWY